MQRVLSEDPIVLIGDVHGDWDFLEDFVLNFPKLNIVQLGDFGMGYLNPHVQDKRLKKLAGALKQSESLMYVVRGNHDDPKYFTDLILDERIIFLEDYSVLTTFSQKTIQLVGGGISVDRQLRKKNKGWWENENVLFSPSKVQKVDYFLTHVPPKYFIREMCPKSAMVEEFCKTDLYLKDQLIQEQNIIQALFDLSEAKYSYFGHFHLDTSCTDSQGRFFRCVDINEALEIKV